MKPGIDEDEIVTIKMSQHERLFQALEYIEQYINEDGESLGSLSDAITLIGGVLEEVQHASQR
jgi:hypothetical protein